MARLPLVAIVGRPNTGKSTLFNRMIGSRVAIESDIAGTTRDHVVHRIEADDVEYLLADTGGIGGGTSDYDFEKDVQGQSLLAIEAADVIVLTVNSREELTRGDLEAVELLRKRKRKHVPVIIALTKVDHPKNAEGAEARVLELGLTDEIIQVSGSHGLGVGELEEVIEGHLLNLHFGKTAKDETLNQDPRIAIVGKPNVGKSSFVNALMSEEQRGTSPRLVSDIPGTTRDSADTIIRHQEKNYVFVDTAGLKRNAKTERGIDEYAMLRSLQAIEDADLALLLLDGSEPISKQDKRIASLVVEAGKGLMIFVNKSDTLDAEKKAEKLKEIEMHFQFCRFAPVLFGSAKTRDGLLKIFLHMEAIHRNRARRLPVKELHRWLEDSVRDQPMRSLSQAKHIVQAEEKPPTFVLFVRDSKRIGVSQLRFLENRMREQFGFDGTPIKWILKTPSAKDDSRSDKH